MRKILLFCICAFVLCACGNNKAKQLEQRKQAMLLSLWFASCKITKICQSVVVSAPKICKRCYNSQFIVTYYDTNSWSFTHFGKINGALQAELKAALGRGDASVTLSLE